MKSPRIVSIELTPLHVPFRKMVRDAMVSGEGGLGMAIPSDEDWLGGDFVICKLITDDGQVGLAESYVWLPETGISPASIIDSVKNALGKYVLGESPFNIEKINYKMDINVTRNEVPKGLLDIACYDLMGKITGRPACDFMGGKSVEKISCAALIPLDSIDKMVEYADSFRAMGYQTFRYKLGRKVKEDLEITKALRDHLGPDVRLRVDYNQAYTPSNAIKSIKAIEPYDIDYAEQPVNINNIMGMAYVQSKVDTPLMAHESFFSLQDFITMVELKAVRCLGMNTERPGGITKALKCLNYAKMKGLTTVLHNQPLGIGTAVLVHFAAANYNSLGH
ncbi:MAG: mandelate racemase/muconate lactonizing enzyme family protein, partial [archaeon]|nr:mandelate racemase/muconate lactonizing enzyme family protein [archaeon]